MISRDLTSLLGEIKAKLLLAHEKFGEHADFRVTVSAETMALIRAAQPELDGHEVMFGDYLVVSRGYVPASCGCMIELAATDPAVGVEEKVAAGECIEVEGDGWGYDHPEVTDERPRRYF